MKQKVHTLKQVFVKKLIFLVIILILDDLDYDLNLFFNSFNKKWYELKKIERHVPIWELFLIILAVYIAIMLLFLVLFGHTFGY